MTTCPACLGTGRERHWRPSAPDQLVRIYAVGKFESGRVILTKAKCAACKGTGKLAHVLLR